MNYDDDGYRPATLDDVTAEIDRAGSSLESKLDRLIEESIEQGRRNHEDWSISTANYRSETKKTYGKIQFDLWVIFRQRTGSVGNHFAVTRPDRQSDFHDA
jgi:hypothetical protein